MRVFAYIRRFAGKFARDDSGMALMMVVAVSAIVFVMLATSLTMIEHRETQTTKYTGRNRAMQLADAGLNEYMYQLSEDYRFYSTNPELEPSSPQQDGTWKVTATPPGEAELLTLTSTGTLNDGTSRTIKATVKFPNFVDYCVFVIQDYNVGEGFTFDGKVYVTGWLTMHKNSEVTGLAMSNKGFKINTGSTTNTVSLTNNRLAPGPKPYTGGARKLENPLTMDSVTKDLAAMKEAAISGGIYLPVYDSSKYGNIPSSGTTDIDNQTFASSTWPSAMTILNTSPYTSGNVRTTNASGRASSTYAAEIYLASGTTRREGAFYRDYDLSSYSVATLSFWNRTNFTTGGSGSDYARVEYSTDGGSTWTQLHNQTSTASGTNRSFTFDVPESGTVRIRFSGSVNATTEYASWDNIKVTGGRWFTARQGYRLTFSNATVKVEAVTWESQYEGRLKISNTAPLAAGFTVPIPANGIIYVEGPCWVQGTYSKKVTIGVPAPHDIIVPDNLKYSSSSPKATCGLVAGGDVAFPHWYASMPDDLYVYAAMLSQQGFVNIDRPRGGTDTNYYPANWKYASAYASNKKNSVNLIGSRAMDNMGAGLAQGFVIRNSEPDPRLYDDPPPMYPNVQGEELKIMSWSEK